MANSKAPYEIVWRPLAEADLDKIVYYIAQDSPINAQKFGYELRNKTLLLAKFAQIGRTGRGGLPEWLHELVVHKNYIVFYRVLKESRTIEILRIKHAAQQIP